MPDRMKIPSAFWDGADRLGIGRSAILRTSALPLGVARDDASVSTSQFFALWQALETLGGNEVGLRLARALDGSVMPPSFLVAYHAKTYGDALRRVARFKSLCAPEDLTITTGDDVCVIDIAWPHAHQDTPIALTDATLVSLVELARSAADPTFRPLRLDLRRDRNAQVAAYFDCPITWNAPKDRLTLRTRDLDLPFRSYNRELLSMLDAALGESLDAKAEKTSLADQVRWLLGRALTAGRPDLPGIARELAVSERSLQRRLSEAGVSFQALLSDTRHRLALEYLSAASLDNSEIAYLLGYDDQGSFYRAFQKWEGCTPSDRRGTKTSA